MSEGRKMHRGGRMRQRMEDVNEQTGSGELRKEGKEDIKDMSQGLHQHP